MRVDPVAFRAKIEEFRKLERKFDDAFGTYNDETITAVDVFRLEHGLDYRGNARGSLTRGS